MTPGLMATDVHASCAPRAGRRCWQRYCCSAVSTAVAGLVSFFAADVGSPLSGKFDQSHDLVVMPLTRQRLPVDLDVSSTMRMSELLLVSNATAHSQMIPSTNHQNTQYSIIVGLGTPGQKEQLLIDTGSSDMWVNQGRFDINASSTAVVWEDEITIQYGQGGVRGRMLSDDLRVGDVLIRSQSFVTLTSEDSSMASIAADGLLGLGPPLLSHTGTTFLQNLRAQAGNATFCLLLTPYVEGSCLVLGQPPASWIMPRTLVYVPVVSAFWWAFEGAMVVGGDVVQNGPFLLDSGTSFLTAPQSKYFEFIDKLLPTGSRSLCRMNHWTWVLACPCRLSEGMRSVEIRVAGQAFPIPTESLFVPLWDSPGECLLEVQPVSDYSPQVLGDTFLRTVVAIFDSDYPDGPRIGLAKRSREALQVGANNWVIWVRRVSIFIVLVSATYLVLDLTYFVWQRCSSARGSHDAPADGLVVDDQSSSTPYDRLECQTEG